MKSDGNCRITHGIHSSVLLTLVIGINAWTSQSAVTASPRGAMARRGPIVNLAADGMVECCVPPIRIDGTHSKQELIEAFRKTVDHYADAQVPYLFFNICYMRAACPSDVWDTYWDIDDPDANTTGWPRAFWLAHTTNVDPFAVGVTRCRERGISPWLSMRMNDTHYLDDPTKTATLWRQHPELRRAANGGYDFAHEPVRKHYLALVAELMERYDCDGIELDWMRSPSHFKTGQEQEGRRHLNDFMRRAHQLALEATEKRGHPVKIAARIPAVPEFAQGLGMDGVMWAREGWIDMLILASVWRPSDTDIPIQRWRDLIGPTSKRVLLAAGTDLWLQAAPGGKVMSNDLETQRGFTAAMLDRGADWVYLFNHFNASDFERNRKALDGSTIRWNEHQDLLRIAGCLDLALEGPRRHVLTFHDPSPPGLANPKPLPVELAPNKAAQFQLYTGPAPSTGHVIVRVGLDNLPGVAEARLSARLNNTDCTPIQDVAKPDAHKSYAHDASRVFHVSRLAQRMLQLEARLEAMRRGYNQIELRLSTDNQQKVIWLEIYAVP